MTDWTPEALARIQELLDRSAATATPVVGRVFARDEWRLDARTFLDTWNGVFTASCASATADGRPHLAALGAQFDAAGRLTMRMYEGSVRQKDFAGNPRVVLQKLGPEGTVMTVYGTPRVVPDSYMPNQTTPGTPGSHEVEVAITRVYAMRPRRG